MAIKEITYDDKVDLQLWGNVSDVNKIKADDMNEIKNTVNNNAKELILNEDNQIHITTEQSSTINVQDCSNLSAKIDVYGVSSQETRSGKNKLVYPYKDLSDSIIEDLGDGRLKLNGTLESNKSKAIQEFLLKAGTYKLIFNKELLPNQAYFLLLNVDNGEYIISGLRQEGTFELSEDANVRLSLVLTTGTYSNYELDLMILESTQQDETFEEYGESPSPKYHSEIENTTGNVKITSCNKNLFNKNTVTEGKNIGNNGEFVINNNYFISDYILINKNVSLALTGIEWGRIAFYDKDKNFIKYSANAESNDLIATSTEDTKYAVISSIIATIDNVQLEVSNTATEFEAHEEEVKTFPLAQNQKMFEGSETKDDGIHHIIKQIELDGTENVILFEWTTPHNKTTMFKVMNIIAKKTDAIKFCNYFKRVKNTAENLDKDEEYCLSDRGGAIAFSISNDIATTVEQFKTWLAQKKQEEKPVLVEYQLLEEEVEPYTEAQQEAYNQLQNVTPYKLVTNISTDKAKLQFNYIADTKTYIDNQINQRLSNLENQVLELAGGN